MRNRIRNLSKYVRMGPYGIAASVIIALSVIFRTILVLFYFPETNSDEGKMGIAGMHIAFQGQHPIYHYGQDYLGVLEAYIAAPFFRLFGVSIFTLRIGMIIMFALFMIVMYWLTSLLYSKRLALMMLLAYRLAATAGEHKRWRYLLYFGWGWTAGIALWVHILVLPFVVCSGLLILVFCYREWR